jgi:hypothetical protein
MQLVAPFLTVAARLKRMYADVPCPNAEVNALSMAASSAKTSGSPNRRARST